MKIEPKKKLIELGAERLADALLELALLPGPADDMVNRLTAAPDENIQRYKKKLALLKGEERCVSWRESSDYAMELERLLEDLQAGVSDPISGLKLLAELYEADEAIVGHCDDSSGTVGSVFTFTARELFAKYGSRCKDKAAIADIILEILRKDDYGVRGDLINCAADCLPESDVRCMIEILQGRVKKEGLDHKKRRHWILIESLAKQIKDAELFEQTRITSWGKLNSRALIHIATVYLESGDIEAAMDRLQRIPEGESRYEREELLMEIYRLQGNEAKLTEVLYSKFRSCHSSRTLEALLEVIGHDKRDEVLAEEIMLILGKPRLSEFDAEFLISIGRIDDAEQYLLERAEQLNGINYITGLDLVKTMEAAARNLLASLLYRSLLVSILDRAYSKAYHHGVRYLKNLDKLAPKVEDWNAFEDHDHFKDDIYQTHGRKRSFWSKYEGKK